MSALLEDYDSATGVFSNLTLYTAYDEPGVITHFENITAVPGGFDLVATTDSGPAFAFIPVNPDGTFGSATWVPIDLPGTDLLTGNIAYQSTIGGIYSTSAASGGPASYLGVVDQSFVTSDGGLVMPVGSHDFAYALSVSASVGATISGSTSAGNMLGGSIGNDTFVGTSSTSASDTIFTGGGSDSITLATSHTASDRIELYAANGLADPSALTPGGVAPSVSGSIVDANDVPQLGWWGQANGAIRRSCIQRPDQCGRWPRHQRGHDDGRQFCADRYHRHLARRVQRPAARSRWRSDNGPAQRSSVRCLRPVVRWTGPTPTPTSC